MSTVSWTCGIKFDDKKSLGEYIQTSTTPEKQHNNAVIMNMHTCWACCFMNIVLFQTCKQDYYKIFFNHARPLHAVVGVKTAISTKRYKE